MSDNLVARILCVDDEVDVLYALKRLLRSSDFIVDLASDADQALDMVMQNNYDLIISDMRMPKIDGAELLSAAAKFSPTSRRVLLTGYSDQEATARAINQGKIHAYIEKPWDNRQFVDRIVGLLHSKMRDDEQAREVETLKESYESMKVRKLSLNDQVRRTNRQLEKTVAFLNVEQEELRQNFKIFLKIFSSTSMRHCNLSPDYMINLLANLEMCAERLYMSDNQLECVYQAAKLAQIGKLNLPPEVACVSPEKLSERQFQQLRVYPIESVNMLTPIDALHETMVIILHHQEHFDGSGYPYGFSEHNISLGGRLLKILMDYNLFVTANGPGLGLSKVDALEKLREGAGSIYDPDLLEICINVLQNADKISYQGNVDLDSLTAGDELAKDAYTNDGLLLAAAGTHLSDAIIHRFRDIQNSRQDKLTFSIK